MPQQRFTTILRATLPHDDGGYDDSGNSPHDLQPDPARPGHILEVELAPGGGNAPHYHTSFFERFTPIAGELGVQVGKEQRVLRPGESALVKQREVHRFYNDTDQPIRFYVEIRPAHAGFEQSLRIGYGLAADGQTNAAGIPKKLLALAVLIELSDTRLIGPLSLLNPIFVLLARIGRLRGVDAALVARYAPHTMVEP